MSPEARARLRARAEAARDASTAGAIVETLEALFEPELPCEVVALLDALETAEARLLAVRNAATYPASRSGGAESARWVLYGREILRALDGEEES